MTTDEKESDVAAAVEKADAVTLLRSRAAYAAEYGPPSLAGFLRRVADMVEQERAAETGGADAD